MLDMHIIREKPDLVKQACINKKDPADIDAVLKLDE